MRLKLINKKITFTKNNMMIFTADMFNEDDPFGNPPRLPKYSTINQEFIKAMLERPQDFEYVNCMFPYTAKLPSLYLRVDKYGKPKLKGGKAVIINSMTVWAAKAEDADTGQLIWVEDPNTIVQRILFRHYIPVQLG